ncbi:hypothetical protein [Microbacterium alcoholitolerans]|uniref:hypothetical protein n=1 Tax=unclassified Microbacterium TaxID=2609290 RepID=UPI003D17F866
MRNHDDTLTAIRAAIAELRAAAQHDGDARRGEVADRLDELFGGVRTRADLRAAIKSADRYYRGGMGSFQDVGTSVMHEAVERLRRSLRRTLLPW